MKLIVLPITLALAAPLAAQSNRPAAPLADTQLADPRQEAAARALMGELRCLVCEGQSIADSDAEMAGDMRALVRERIARGERPAAIRAWLIERYGPTISYDPPLGWASAPLWAAPLVLLALAALVAARVLRRRGRRA